MQRVIFLYLSFIFLYLSISASAKDPFEGQEEKAKAFIGKTYWVCQGWDNFKQTPDIYKSDNITILQPAIAFTIVELIPSLSDYKGRILKIKYDNGEIGYISFVLFETYLPIFTQKPIPEMGCNIRDKTRKIFETNPLQDEEICQKGIDEIEAKEREEKSKKKAKLQNLLESKIGAKLPPSYKGHDIEHIYMIFFQTLLGKGEFEKTEDYKKRLQAVNLDDVYAFRVTNKDGLNLKYDPDNELLHLEIDTLTVNQIMPRIEDIDSFIVLKTTSKKISSYVGSNAFGAKKQIKKYDAQKYGVHVLKMQSQPQPQLYDSLDFNLSISDAKKYKDNLNALIICRPYIKDDTLAFVGGYYAEPTFKVPIGISYAVSGINIELLEIWIYDFKTGKILHKESIYE